jgi:hypothetical protein
MTHANDLTFLFLESFFMVIRLPCLSAYAFGSRVAFSSAYKTDMSCRMMTYQLVLCLPPILPLLCRVTSEVLPYSREVCNSNLGLHEVSNFNTQLSEVICMSALSQER